MEKTRPKNELEGTLLLKTETYGHDQMYNLSLGADYGARPPIPPPSNPYHVDEGILEAVPLLPFEMDNTKENFSDVPSAPAFEQNEGTLTAGAKQTNMEAYRIKTGTAIGKMNEFEEQFEIRKGVKTANFKQMNESEKLKLANQVAQIRIKEENEGKSFGGNQLSKPAMISLEKTTLPTEESSPITSKKGNQGYQTSDYEISSYEDPNTH